MSGALDVFCGLVVALAGFIGLVQGLTVMILRGAVVVAGMLSFKFLCSTVETLLESHLSESAAIISIILVVLGILLVQQIAAWCYRKLRDAMLLGIPDRILGLFTGILISIFFLSGILIKVAEHSGDFDQVFQESRVRAPVEKIRPYLSKALNLSEDSIKIENIEGLIN